MDRRHFLCSASATIVLPLVGCKNSNTSQGPKSDPQQSTTATSTGGSRSRPRATGKVTEVELSAGPVEKQSRSGRFTVFGYNGRVPGPEIRVKEGDTLRVRVNNRLPDGTTIHWHGVPVPNPMDGVPGVTQKSIPPGESFTYEFVAWPAGTYIYHSHEGYQLDQGLYGPLVIEERTPDEVDREFVLVLEDWATADGGGPAASRAGRTSSRGMMGGMMGPGMMGTRGMGGRGMHGRGMGPGGMGPGGMGPGGMGPGGMGPGRMGRGMPPAIGDGVSGGEVPLLEPQYNAYSINGKLETPGEVLRIRKGERARLRLINASSSSIYYVRLAGHDLTVTHADGRPVEPVTVDTIRIGMGERYDARIEANNAGRWPILVWPDTTTNDPLTLGALVYEGVQQTGYSGDSGFRGRMLGYDELVAREEENLPRVGGEIDRRLRMVLSGGMHSRHWTINGDIFPNTKDPRIEPGERIRIEYYNRSMMPHPMHLHGHFFELDLPGRPRKDTVIVEPHMGFMALEFVADNPGDWFHHCHNLYHLMGGMANVLRYPEQGG